MGVRVSHSLAVSHFVFFLPVTLFLTLVFGFLEIFLGVRFGLLVGFLLLLEDFFARKQIWPALFLYRLLRSGSLNPFHSVAPVNLSLTIHSPHRIGSLSC